VGGALVALEPGRMADNPPMMGPAGTVHGSLGDWARMVALHLDPDGGSLLLGATLAALHTPYPGPGDAGR
jgi:hypothetical protein